MAKFRPPKVPGKPPANPRARERVIWKRAETWAALAAGLALVGALLCLPWSGDTPQRPLRILVLDTSASLTRTRPDLPAHYRELLRAETRTARAEGADFALARLGPRLEVWRPAGPVPEARWEGEPAWWTHQWEPDSAESRERVGTDWVGLGVWLIEQYEGGRLGTVRLASDGEGRRHEDFAFVGELARRGIPIEKAPLPKASRTDWALLEGRAPHSIPAGASFQVSLAGAWKGHTPTQAAPVQVRLATGGQPGPWRTVAEWKPRARPPQQNLGQQSTSQQGPQGADNPGGWQRERLELEMDALPSGWYDLEVRILAAGDRTPENDRWRTTLVVGDPYLVLAAGEVAPMAAALATGTGQNPIVLRAVEPGEWERWLPQADAVYTAGRAPTELPGAALEAFVQSGGAWCFQAEWEGLSGWGSLPPPGRWDVGRLLPLEVEYGDGGERDVCLLVDGSGSMEGIGWSQVQRACEALMRGLPVQDGLRLHLFTRDLMRASLRFDPLPLDAPAEQRERARRERSRAREALLSTRVPGGPTDILRSLRSLASQSDPNRRTLAVLITDGHESGAMPQSASQVRAACSQAGIELRIVATGERPNVPFLKRLLLPGEELTLATDWERLPEWLQREVLGDALRIEDGMRVKRLASGQPEWAQAPSLAEPARVDRYLRTRLRPGARALWTAREGEPLLAATRWGEGLVYALPARPAGRIGTEQRVALRDLMLQAAAWGRRSKQSGPRLLAVEGQVHLHGAPPGPWELWVQTAASAAPMRLATEPLPIRFGLHPLENRRVVGAPEGVRSAQLRRAGDPSQALRLPWPQRPHSEFRPPGALAPLGPARFSPVKKGAPEAKAGPHPWGPPLLGIALLALLGSIWILGSGVKESGS